MSTQVELDKLRVEEFIERCRDAMTPLSNKFSYFPATPLGEEDVKEYLEEPIAALPPKLAASLPKISIALVPYLEKLNGKEKEGASGDVVSFEKPPENRQSRAALSVRQEEARLVFAVRDRHVSEYHYDFYHAIAELVADREVGDCLSQFFGLLREELSGRVHGEVDRQGWHLKQGLLRRQTNVRRETKLFREYARQSFIDTLTLYLHGICCDIDVETGPRQLPSRCLRKRLELLESLYPPPDGYAVFPEELNKE